MQETPQMREESGAILGSAENPYKAAKLTPFTTQPTPMSQYHAQNFVQANTKTAI